MKALSRAQARVPRPGQLEAFEPRVLLSGLPVLAAPTNINCGSGPLNAGSYSVVAVADWNNDAKKDLLIGCLEGANGRIYVCLNTGSEAAPAFSAKTAVYCSGAPITVTGGSG